MSHPTTEPQRPARKDSFISASFGLVRSTLGEFFSAPIFGTTAGVLLGGYMSFADGQLFMSSVLIYGGIGLVLGLIYMIKDWFF